MITTVWRAGLALTGGVLLGIGMVTAPGTATVAAKTVPGRTMVVVVSGLEPGTVAKVRVTGPRKYAKTLRVDGRSRVKKLRPGRYTLKAKRVGDARAVDRVQKVRVKKQRGARVRFTYRVRPPDTTAPAPVRNLRATEVTATTIALAWDNPPDDDFLEVSASRSGGTAADPLDFELSTAGESLRDFGLTPRTAYRYTITTIDEAGNSSAGKSITVTTLSN